MQPIEKYGQLFIIIADESYTEEGTDESDLDERSEQFRRGIERQYGVPFIEANVGPGADLPAFLTVFSTVQIPLWTLLFSTFFMGKSINANLDGWYEIAKKIRSFFPRQVFVSRHGASALAIEKVFEEMDGLPKSIQLKSYGLGHWGGHNDLGKLKLEAKIDEAGDIILLGPAVHLFEIVADGIIFRVGVSGTDVFIQKM